MAAVLTCIATYMHDFPSLATDPAANVLRTALFLGTYIGGVTFSGSLVAYGKLQGILSSSPLLLPGRHFINGGLLAGNALAMGAFYMDPTFTGGLGLLGATAAMVRTNLWYPNDFNPNIKICFSQLRWELH